MTLARSYQYAPGLGFAWGDIITNLTNTASTILTGRYGKPAGYYEQRGADGSSTVYVQPTGNPQNVFGANTVTGTIGANANAPSTTTMLMIGAGVLAVVFMMNRGR